MKIQWRRKSFDSPNVSLIFLSSLALNKLWAWGFSMKRSNLTKKYCVIHKEKTRCSVRGGLQALKNIFTVYSQCVTALLSRFHTGKQSCTVKNKYIKLVSTVQCPAKNILIHPEKNKNHLGRTQKKSTTSQDRSIASCESARGSVSQSLLAHTLPAHMAPGEHLALFFKQKNKKKLHHILLK